MEVIQSKRGSVFVKDGYIYHKNKNLKGGVKYLRCREDSCKSRAKIVGKELQSVSEHNHPPDEIGKELLLLRAALRWEAITDTCRKPRRIFQDVCMRYPKAAHLIGYENVRTTIYRLRNNRIGYRENEGEDTSIPDEIRDTSIPDEIRDTSIPVEMRDTSIPVEIIDISIPVEIRDTSIPVEIRDTSIPVEIRDTSIPVEIRDTSIPDEIGDTSIPDEIRGKKSTSFLEEIKENEDIIFLEEIIELEDDGDDGAQTDVNSLHSNTNKAQTATKKVESQEAAGPSNIENQQCDSSGNVQSESIEASPLLYVDTTFGILEESGMGQFLPTPSVDGSSSQSQVDTEEITNKDKEKEAQEKHNASSMATLISPTCTRVPIDAPTFKFGNVTQARNYTRDKEKNSSKAKVDTDHRAKVDTNHRAKFDQMINAVMSQKKLDSVINKLESLSKTFAVAAENDKYENFGKYISSLLRGLPNRKVISLKKKMISQVMEALTEENKQRGINSIGIQVDANDIEPPMLFASLGDPNVNELQKTVKNICFQVDSKKSSRKAPIGLSRAGKCGVSAAAKSLVTNKNSMLGGTLPILFPGASTSNSSFKLLPVMPVSSPAVGSGATVLTSTSSLVAPLQPLPISSGETITTVAKSADGTLIAVTIPKPTEMQQLQVLGPRCQKRKQPTHTAAYLIKKSCPFPPSPQTSCSLPMSPMSHTVVASNSSSCQSSTSQFVRVSQTLSHVGNRNNEEVQEFDMDIEDGNELKPIPGCKEYFETVICGEDSVMYIKEEEPDVYENPTTPADNSPIAYNQEEEPDPNTNPTTPADNSPIASAQEEEPDPNTNPTTQVDNSLTTYAQEEEPDPNTNLSTAVDNSPTVFAQEEEPDPNTTPTTAVDNSSITYAQEEEPDPNTNPTTAAGLPHTATTSFICSLCDVSCENKDELNRHCSTVHPGCIPAESSGDSHHVL